MEMDEFFTQLTVDFIKSNSQHLEGLFGYRELLYDKPVFEQAYLYKKAVVTH